MTVGKKFKKKVRERMLRTGESYMAARQHLIDHPRVPMKLCEHPLVDGKCAECGYPDLPPGK